MPVASEVIVFDVEEKFDQALSKARRERLGNARARLQEARERVLRSPLPFVLLALALAGSIAGIRRARRNRTLTERIKSAIGKAA